MSSYPLECMCMFYLEFVINSSICYQFLKIQETNGGKGIVVKQKKTHNDVWFYFRKCNNVLNPKRGEWQKSVFGVNLKLLDLIYFILQFRRLKSNVNLTLHLMLKFNRCLHLHVHMTATSLSQNSKVQYSLRAYFSVNSKIYINIRYYQGWPTKSQGISVGQQTLPHPSQLCPKPCPTSSGVTPRKYKGVDQNQYSNMNVLLIQSH